MKTPKRSITLHPNDVIIAQNRRLVAICKLLNNIHSSPDTIVDYIKTEIEKRGALIDGLQFIDYVYANIYRCEELDIWGRGNPLLDECRAGNLFELLCCLKDELSKVDTFREAQHSTAPHGIPNLPHELDTERARKYFSRALDRGYMVVKGGKYRWVDLGIRGNKVKLGYFLLNVFCPKRIEVLPETSLNYYFEIHRIGSTITHLLNAIKLQRWRDQIDKELFYD